MIYLVGNVFNPDRRRALHDHGKVVSLELPKALLSLFDVEQAGQPVAVEFDMDLLYAAAKITEKQVPATAESVFTDIVEVCNLGQGRRFVTHKGDSDISTKVMYMKIGAPGDTICSCLALSGPQATECISFPAPFKVVLVREFRELSKEQLFSFVSYNDIWSNDVWRKIEIDWCETARTSGIWLREGEQPVRTRARPNEPVVLIRAPKD